MKAAVLKAIAGCCRCDVWPTENRCDCAMSDLRAIAWRRGWFGFAVGFSRRERPAEKS